MRLVRFGRARAARGSGRLAEDLGFHRRLPGRVRTALAEEPRGRAVALAALLALWQGAYAAGFAAEAVAGLSRAAPRARRRAAGA